MFIHDTIKINYISEGYLPNFPYHLISDKEMIDAFISEGGYWDSNYPCLDPDLQDSYNELKGNISYHLNAYLESGHTIPDWVYSYMLGNCISVSSSDEDITYLSTLLGIDGVPSEIVFDKLASSECYKVSKQWLAKLPESQLDHRSPTMFGEPHVIKSLRLDVSI